MKLIARTLACCAVLVFFLSACTPRQATIVQPAKLQQPVAPVAEPAPVETLGQRIARIALSMIGSPYQWGARGPDRFDCSGLVQYSFQAAGLSVPRTSRQQFRTAVPVPLDEAEPGDLIFFRFEDRVSHVGIYLDDDRFVHAPAAGRNVSIDALSDAGYRPYVVGAGRLY